VRERFYIAIEGAIGVGKTTLARLMKERLNAELLLEVFEANPFLSSFYQDRARYAFQTQIFFLLSRYQQQNNVIRRTLEHYSLVSDYMFAKDRLFAQLNLAGEELAMYERVHAALARIIPLPDLVVFMRADTDVLMQRIASRDRTYERDMSRQYIDDLHAAYESFFTSYSECPVLKLDTNDLNFVSDPDDLNSVVQTIRAAIENPAYQPSLLNGLWNEGATRPVPTTAGSPPGLASFQQPAPVVPAGMPEDLPYAYMNMMSEIGRLGAQIASLSVSQEQYELQAGNRIEARQRALEEHLPSLQEGVRDSLKRLIELAQLTGADLGQAGAQAPK